MSIKITRDGLITTCDTELTVAANSIARLPYKDLMTLSQQLWSAMPRTPTERDIAHHLSRWANTYTVTK